MKTAHIFASVLPLATALTLQTLALATAYGFAVSITRASSSSSLATKPVSIRTDMNKHLLPDNIEVTQYYDIVNNDDASAIAEKYNNAMNHSQNQEHLRHLRHVQAMPADSLCPNSEGAWFCMSKTFQRCATGVWSREMGCAKGTVCEPHGITAFFNAKPIKHNFD
ncbi:hypothetical protein BD289DRAFT_452277 [Coniella lustricola]|uniref:Uncharacterized protein n=1 Tax=Coniella lustricola TaxID=2025994 RepID=A0A2T3ABU8_9PEZI|nr:hypothetical protein BD289DRAFT_452277 [Coniella lustricola]